MARSQSPTAPVPGGTGRPGGSGWRQVRALLTLIVGVAAAGGTGCLTAGKYTRSMKEALGLGAKPATLLTTAFIPQVQHLTDPTREDGTKRPGIQGQMYLVAADGQFTEVDGDLYVMAEDITPRPPGIPAGVPEMWHFDKHTLRKLKANDERFGRHFALFLPYPPNWKDVTQIRVSAQYEPKPESGTVAGPKLSSPPQVINLDFTPPGAPVWTKVEGRPTAPVELKGIPDLGKAIAQGKVGAPLAGPQPGAAAPSLANAPPLPPPTDMTRNPYAVAPGPNGSTIHTAAVALPPGQTVPPGWTMNANRELVPVPGTNPWAMAQQPPSQPNTARQQVPPAAPVGAMPAIPVSANYPVAPAAPPGGYSLPPSVPASLPPPPADLSSGSSAPLPNIPLPGGGQSAAGFDPNAPVGPWANGPNAPQAGLPPMALPTPPGGVAPAAGGTMVIPRR
jgi:hypothetical protein